MIHETCFSLLSLPKVFDVVVTPRILLAAVNLIFSIHSQQNGNRFATGGGDNCVKVWNLVAALDAAKEKDGSCPKLLATLTDHNGPVNVVRFSPVSSLLASGSDDGTAAMYELHNGPGGGNLGGEANVENWRTKFLMKGHSSNIVDLSWSPDGMYLATASLDNTVMVWETETGKPVKTITHHRSFVKGVAWDPVGTYLATQSEDESVAIWKRDDWSLAGRISSPFRSMVSTTFSMRLSWSPDGQYIMAGNSYQGSTHVAVAVSREKWDKKDDYLLICGHRGVVVSPCFSPRLYHVPPLGGGAPSESLTPIFALGAQDGKVSVWAASAERAYFVGKRFFDAQVLDVSWTPDGRTLLACSADKSVATFQFEEKELGPVATKEEMDSVMKSLYGSAQGRQTKRALIESADQLALEDKAAPPVRSAIQALDARISSSDGVTQTGFGPSSPLGPEKAAAQTTMPPPKKRRTPEEANNASPSKDTRAAGVNHSEVSVLNTTTHLPCLPELKSFTASWQKEQTIAEANSMLSRDFAQGIEAMGKNRVILHVTNESYKVSQYSFAQVKVSGPEIDWCDIVRGSVVAAIGSKDFCAVATSDGHIILYSHNGRRKCAPICIGSGISNFALASSNPRVFLAVSTSGIMRVYDAVEMKEMSETNLASILEGKRTVIDVSLSSTGSPMVATSDSCAYVWHSGLKSWTKIMDASTCLSNFYPLANLSGQGEVNNIQSRARKDCTAQSALLLGRTNATNVARYHVSRSHIEGNLVAAASLKSTEEFKNFLMSYAQLLVDSRDEARLKELSDDLILGKMTGSIEFERTLLKDIVIPVLVAHRDFSQLVQRCQDIISDVQ